MKFTKLLVVTSLLFLGVVYAEVFEHTDPVDVSPQMYTVLLENEHVRVVRYVIEPGQRDRWHTHPAKISYVASGGTLRITTANGESFEVREETGDASWMSALGKHFAENVGESPVSVILVEVKAAGR